MAIYHMEDVRIESLFFINLVIIFLRLYGLKQVCDVAVRFVALYQLE